MGPFFQLLMAFCHKDTVEKRTKKKRVFAYLLVLFLSSSFFPARISMEEMSSVLSNSFFFFFFVASLFGDFPTHPTHIFNQEKTWNGFICMLHRRRVSNREKTKIK